MATPQAASDIIGQAKEQLPNLIGKPAESVSGIERAEDNGWRVTLEVLELERIPPTTDVLGTYEVLLDEEGTLQSFQRIYRYHRSQATRE